MSSHPCCLEYFNKRRVRLLREGYGFAYRGSVVSLFLYLLSGNNSCAAEEVSPTELDKWFEQDDIAAIEKVSEGELRFITEKPGKPVLHSLNKLVIYPSSIDDGWVSLSQCYRNLDPVAASEVVYQYRAMRDLKIVSYKNIGAAKIKEQSIQLTEVNKAAELCVSARVRIFYSNPDGTFSLINGPFHRRFLDGFFPYHLTLEVEYPVSRLELKQTIPAEQPGFNVEQEGAGKLLLDVIFEGILNVELVFSSNKDYQE